MEERTARSYEEWVEVVLEELRKRVIAMRWGESMAEELTGAIRQALVEDGVSTRYYEDPMLRTVEEAAVLADEAIATRDREIRLMAAAVAGDADAIEDVLREVPPDAERDGAMVKFFRAICECDAEGRWQEAEPIPYDEWVKLATHRARTRLTRRELEEIGPQLDEEIRQALAPARQMPGMWNAEEAEVLAVARACSSVRRYKAMTALGRGDMRAVYDIIGWMTGPERVTTCSSMVRRGLPVVQGDGRVVVRMSTLVTFGSVGRVCR